MAFSKSDPARRRALSWPLLKAYYSSFFGGHALLRVVGQAVIRLEPTQVKKLSEIGQLFCGPGFSVASGTFDLRLTQNADRTIDVTLIRLDETGGAHNVFWRRFNTFLGELAIEICSNNEPDSLAVIAKLQELQAVLTASGALSGSWLSTVRNQINYQHQFGVWFPFGAAEADVRHVERLGRIDLATARLDFDCAKQPLRAFCAGSLFIATLSSDVSSVLFTKASSRGAIARNWRRLMSEAGTPVNT